MKIDKTSVKLSAVQDQSANTKRRAVVGALAGTTVALWHKPIVDAVLLPAHAQTSMPPVGPSSATFFAGSAAPGPLAQSNSVLDFLIPVANAGINPMSSTEFAVSVEQPDSSVDSYNVGLFERRLEGETNVGELLYNGTLTAASGGTLTLTSNPCDVGASDIDAEIVSASDVSVILNLNTLGQSVTVPAGSGSLPIPMCVVAPLPPAFSLIAAGNELGIQSTESNKFSPLDMLVPAVHAGETIEESEVSIIAVKVSEEVYTVTVQDGFDQVSGNLNVDGTSASLAATGESCGQSSLICSISNVSEAGMTVSVEFQGPVLFDLDPESGILPPLFCINSPRW